MTPAETSVPVALLVNSPTLPRWQRDALQVMVAETDAEITQVVLRETEARDDGALDFVRDAAKRFEEYPLWSLLGVVRTVTADPPYKQQVPITTIRGVASAEWLTCRPTATSGLGNELPDGIVDSVEREADVAVRFGFGILTGRILDVPTHGVLSYHFGDIRRHRGRPGGLWELLGDDDRVGVTVQQLSETLDGGRIVALDHVDISDDPTWQQVRHRCVDVARGLLAVSITRLTDTPFTPSAPAETGELHTLPQGSSVVSYLVTNTRNRLVQLVQSDDPIRPLRPGRSRRR